MNKTVDELIAMRHVALAFLESAELIERRIAAEGLSHTDGSEITPGSNVTKRQKWMALKAVSHFNLGQSFELLLKLVLTVEGTAYERTHLLTELYDLLSSESKVHLDRLYDTIRNSMVNRQSGVGFYVGRERPPTRSSVEVTTLRQNFLDFDRNLKLHQRRYQWENIGRGEWTIYRIDFSPWFDLLRGISRFANDQMASKYPLRRA